MRAKAWVKNKDPRPRGLVFKIDGAGLTPFWAGIVTTLDEHWDVRMPVDGTSTPGAATREEALEKLAPILFAQRNG